MSTESSSPTLPHRRLGDSSLEVSAIGLGCNNFGWRLDLDATGEVLEAALAAGIDFLDTADLYGDDGASERLIGEVLAGRRDEYVLATKFGAPLEQGFADKPDVAPGSREYVRWAIEGSLRRLQIDRVDLFQMHLPDPQTPIAETLAALAELIEEGMVTAIGYSNATAAELEEAELVAGEEGLPRFVSLQNHYNLGERRLEEEVAPACERLGVSVLPFYPLEGGLLTGKYKRSERPAGSRLAGDDFYTEEHFDVIEGVEAFAAERGLTPTDVAVGWLLAQPSVGSVIAGATRPEQIAANVSALRCRLNEADLAELDRIASRERRLGQGFG
jgi:aryl-alcohol dehydrogenase-like predicted oxidoreductase